MNFVGKNTELERIKQIRLKKYAQKKKRQVSNLNNKIFKSQTNNCTNITKPHIDINDKCSGHKCPRLK